MASRVELFTVTVPAGTAIATPLSTSIPFDIGEVEAVEFLIPPGPNGLMGFQLRHSSAGVFPREDDRWIVANGETIRWPVVNAPTGKAWSVRAYNIGIHNHKIYVRLLIHEVPAPIGTPGPALNIQQPDQVAPLASDVGFPGGVTV